MASTRKKVTNDGKVFYEIRISRGRGQPAISKRWYPESTWSQKTIDKELAKYAADLERQAEEGTLQTLKEKKAAEAAAAAEAAKIQTFSQFCEKVFYPSIKITGAKSTLSTYKRDLRTHVFPTIGDMKITEISPAVLAALLLSLQSKLAVGTCQKIYTTMHTVFSMAYCQDTIIRNPLDKVQRPRPRKDEIPNEEEKAYEESEIIRIIDLVNALPLKWKSFIHLLIDTGCRRGEALGLRWCDIDFENESIVFCCNLCETPEDGIYLDTPKGKKARTVYVDHEVMELLKELKKSKTVLDMSGKGYVFTRSEKSLEPISPRNVNNYFIRFGKRNEIDHFHPHKLRHSYASISLRNGADIASVSQNLGHASVNTTLKTYTHSSKEGQKKAHATFRAALQDTQTKTQTKTQT